MHIEQLESELALSKGELCVSLTYIIITTHEPNRLDMSSRDSLQLSSVSE